MAHRFALGTVCGAALASLLFIGVSCQKREEAKRGDRTPSETAQAPGAPKQSTEELTAPLAKVGDVVITVGEFQDQLNKQSPYIRARYTSLEQKREFLDGLIRFEVLASEAARRGLDKDPEVVRTMKSVMVQKLMRAEFDRTVPPEAISDTELQAAYDAGIAEYVKPEEVRASAIVVKSAAQAKKIATEAAGDAGKTNKAFRELVQKYSTDEDTKVRGGDLRYFGVTTKDVPKKVVAAAFDLPQTGAVSGAIDAGDGTFWVLKQTGHRKATTKTFDDVKQQLRNKLHREKRLEAQEAFVANLRTQAKIEVLENNLAKVRVDTSSQSAADPHDHGAADVPTPAPTAPTTP
jgi:peptidyl-prolyl cis-trans isomerase C